MCHTALGCMFLSLKNVSSLLEIDICVACCQSGDHILPLRNINNTCFVNSIVQLLCAATDIRQLLLAHLRDHHDMGKCQCHE